MDVQESSDISSNSNNLLFSVWKPNGQLAVFSSSLEEAPCIGNVDLISWNENLKNSITRTLIMQSYSIFALVQEARGDLKDQPSNKAVLIKCSRRYRSILRSCSSKLQSNEGEVSDSNQSIVELYAAMELIWSLCEILLIEELPPGVVLCELMQWCKTHFPIAYDLVAECSQSEEPAKHQSYWKAVYALVLQGQISEAREFLKTHHEYLGSSMFQSLDELLRKMPVYDNYQAQSITEFDVKRKYWQEECKSRLDLGDFDLKPELKLICQILCGDDDAFEEIKDIAGSWYQMLISFLFYSNPTIMSFDIHYCCNMCIDMYGGIASLSPLDSILLSTFKFDITQLMGECCAHFSNWWLPLHLTDLLTLCTLHSNSFITNPYKSGCSGLRESLCVKYASELAVQPSMWNIAAEYFNHSGPNSQHYLSLFIERIPLTSEKKARNILKLCSKNGFYKEAQSIQRQMAIKALHQNQLGRALSWSIKSNDSKFVVHIAEKMLMEYLDKGVFSNMDVIDYLGPAIASSERLAFLGKYREFQKLLMESNEKEAGHLLLNLLLSKVAPKEFWISLMMDTLPLLENEHCLVYDSEDTTHLLKCLDELQISKRDAADDEKIVILRKAIVKNLARTQSS